LFLPITSPTPTYALKDEFVYYYTILYIRKVSNAQRYFKFRKLVTIQNTTV